MGSLEARENHSGAYALDGDAHLERPISLSLGWKLRSLSELRQRGIEIAGEVHAPGFADRRAARGWLTLTARTLWYRLEFSSNAGEVLRFEGERRVSLAGMPPALTMLRGRLVDADGRGVGRALLRFDLRNDLWRFLRSIEYRA